MAIRSFGDKSTEEFHFTGRPPKKAGWAGIAAVAKRKLDMIRYASDLRDLRSPPSNRLEALKSDLKGCHSIRINDQWRGVFRWTSAGAEDVRIADYH
ncbi:MAG: type II toxin-antitoxin system RelE/ParE family toxin [Planctomycetes bacterium]|nr:type II toxin-antitoxin system RelE/ParE family toxin [Planctomycetota bacterium]